MTQNTVRKECRKFEYRRNIRMPGRTQYILVDPQNWEILEPVRRERSKSMAHGEDIYCLSEEVWKRVMIVKLKMSNSGRLSYWAGSDNPELEEHVRELEELLALCSDFEDMVETVEKYVSVKRLLRKDGCEKEE